MLVRIILDSLKVLYHVFEVSYMTVVLKKYINLSWNTHLFIYIQQLSVLCTVPYIHNVLIVQLFN